MGGIRRSGVQIYVKRFRREGTTVSVDRIAISSASVDHELPKLRSTFAAVYLLPNLRNVLRGRETASACVHLRILCSAAGAALRPTDGRGGEGQIM